MRSKRASAYSRSIANGSRLVDAPTVRVGGIIQAPRPVWRRAGTCHNADSPRTVAMTILPTPRLAAGSVLLSRYGRDAPDPPWGHPSTGRDLPRPVPGRP